MDKKFFLLGLVLLVAGHFMTAQNTTIKIVSADGTEMTSDLLNVRNIVFEDNTMTVNMKTEYLSYTNITCIRFNQSMGIETLPVESSVSVFPNPVQTNLTVSGVNKNVKINLLNTNGTLLQSIPAQDYSTIINVSSLPQGLYLLQIGEQVIKFIKQ